jgi:predicted RND superfamily exporter protein
MRSFIHKSLSSYVDYIETRLGKAIIIITIITLGATAIASKLTIKSDLKELLPNNYQSVKEINRLLERMGGVETLIVTAESANFDANKRFMDDLAKELQKLPQGAIRYVDYKSDEVKEFYENNFLYYIDTAELGSLYESVERRISYEKLKRTPLFIDFTSEAPLLSDIEDLKNKYQKNYSSPVQTWENYYGGEWGRMLIMMIRPYGSTLTVDKARQLIAAVENTATGLNPPAYDAGMKIGYCGNVKSTVEEYDTLKKDIFSTTFLCISLVSLVIILFFLRIRVVFILALTLAVALSLTFAFTYFFFGYLNAQTAFLGSIILGTGINYGIIVIGRYIEERKKKKEPVESLKIALNATFSSTFLACITTAISFFVLLMAKIKGLSQFGIIGATGVILCWLSSIIVLPVIMLAWERARTLVKTNRIPARKSVVFTVLTERVVNSPQKIIACAVVLTAISIFLTVQFIPNAIEYDFTKLRNKTSVSSGTEALEKRVSRLFKHSMTPAVVLVDKIEDAPKICDAVNRQNMEMPESERRVGSCYSIYNLLPENQDKKLPILGKFKRLLKEEHSLIAKLDKDIQQKISKIQKSLTGRKITLDDMPAALTKHFEDLNHNKGAVVFVNPRPGMLLSDGRNLTKFADTIKDITTADGRTFHAAGASLIFSDIVKIIRNGAPFLAIASFLGVLLFVAAAIKRWRISWVITASLFISTAIMLGIMALFKIKLNFFNFIALPLTFGIGVDYSINIAIRLMHDKMNDIDHALRHTGMAVLLCSLTTIIGYSVLLIANNQALVSFAAIALVGEIICITTAIFIVPALMVLLKSYKTSEYVKRVDTLPDYTMPLQTEE